MSSNVILLANKWWEAVTLVSVLEHGCESKLKFCASPTPFKLLKRKPPQEMSPESRLEIQVGGTRIEVFCLEDFMSETGNSSSSFAKQKILLSLVEKDVFDDALIIAFGTAASPEAESAGNVVLGSSVFVHDGRVVDCTEETANLEQGLGEIVTSEEGESLIHGAELTVAFEQALSRFLLPPNAPSKKPKIFAGSEYVSVGVVNVLNNENYKQIDPEALKQFALVSNKGITESIETTHGLIRLCVERPFLYLSGIANQVGNFGEEVLPNKYSQNFVAAHNAAVCLSWMLPEVCKHLSKQ